MGKYKAIGEVVKEDAFFLHKQKDMYSSREDKYSALLVYRCCECDTVVAATTASGVFDATASQIAGKSQQLRCSKCENKY